MRPQGGSRDRGPQSREIESLRGKRIELESLFSCYALYDKKKLHFCFMITSVHIAQQHLNFLFTFEVVGQGSEMEKM